MLLATAACLLGLPPVAEGSPTTQLQSESVVSSATTEGSSGLEGAGGARGRPGHHKVRAKEAQGLGRTCRTDAACGHKRQKCLKSMDVNGKPQETGFCVLPCLSYEEQTTAPKGDARPDEKTRTELKKKAKPRCPPQLQCRSAGAGVPIDLCVQE